MAAVLARPPTREVGTARPDLVGGFGLTDLPGWDDLPVPHHRVPALQWPQSIDTYAAMLDDPRVWALVQAVALPAQRYVIELEPNGMSPADAALLADDLDLPIAGTDQVSDGRDPTRFSHRRHFARSLSALNVGHSVFEISGEIRDDLWRLLDLAPRPARGLTRWHADSRGRLTSIEQGYALRPIPLRADHLAVYTWQGDDGDPRGASMLNKVYRPFLMKDRLVRLDAIAHERNSMGIPVGWVSDANTPAEAAAMDEILANVAAGEHSFVRLQGVGRQDVKLRGVEGSVSRPLDSIVFHNGEMEVAFLAQVISIGQGQGGSYALSQTQASYLQMFHDVVVQWDCDTLTNQVVSRWCRWNRGADAPIGRVVWRRRDDEAPQPSATPGERAAVAASGRRGSRSPQPVRGRSRRPVAAATQAGGRRLRRELYEHELAAAVDVDQLETQFVSTRDQLAAALLDVRAQLTTAALDAIDGMDTVQVATLGDDLLVLLAQTEIDTHAIVDLLTAAAVHGVAQVVGEADRQGAQVHVPDVDYGDSARAEAAGMIGRLRRAVADSAQTAAQVAAPAGADASVVADAVATHLDGLSTAAADRAASGATSRATNAGRAHALDHAPYRDIYASALLDRNTCGPCMHWDGHQFDTVTAALEQFPAGGNRDCEGFDQCRCTIVAVLETEQDAVT